MYVHYDHVHGRRVFLLSVLFEQVFLELVLSLLLLQTLLVLDLRGDRDRDRDRGLLIQSVIHSYHDHVRGRQQFLLCSQLGKLRL